MKRVRLSPLLFRRIHKWTGLVLGLQFVLWTVSGATMALLDKDKVAAHGMPGMMMEDGAWPADIRMPQTAGPVTGLTLTRIAGRPVFETGQGNATRLVDARDGSAILVDQDVATAVAIHSLGHDKIVRDVDFLGHANLEARDHAGSMWRIDFEDADNSSAYVSARNGRLLVVRNDSYRLWDFVWMLHNMDYVNRASFNHPLIIIVAFGTLWLSLSGFYLLFKSFRRTDFRWITRRFKRAG